MEYRTGTSGVNINEIVREVCDEESTDSIISEKVFTFKCVHTLIMCTDQAGNNVHYLKMVCH